MPTSALSKYYGFAENVWNTGVLLLGRCRHRPLRFCIYTFFDMLKGAFCNAPFPFGEKYGTVML